MTESGRSNHSELRRLKKEKKMIGLWTKIFLDIGRRKMKPYS